MRSEAEGRGRSGRKIHSFGWGNKVWFQRGFGYWRREGIANYALHIGCKRTCELNQLSFYICYIYTFVILIGDERQYSLPWSLNSLILKSKLEVQFSSVTQSYLTLCNPIDCSTPGFPALHQLLELAQTHVHRVGDAIQPSHPLLSPSPPAFNLSQHQGLFQWVGSSHEVARVLELQLQHQSFQDWFPLGLTGLISLQSKGDRFADQMSRTC